MKLDRIPAATVRRAVEIYLGEAYPGSSRWRAPKFDLSGGKTVYEIYQPGCGGTVVGRHARPGCRSDKSIG